MINEDTVLYDVAMHLGANKNIKYKQSIMDMSLSLLRFLHEKNLLVDLTPYNKDGSLKADTVVRKKNLTDEGFELFKNGVVEGWFMYLDRSVAPDKHENISRLERGLKKIRENKTSK